jgi:hypothetical protein
MYGFFYLKVKKRLLHFTTIILKSHVYKIKIKIHYCLEIKFHYVDLTMDIFELLMTSKNIEDKISEFIFNKIFAIFRLLGNVNWKLCFSIVTFHNDSLL